MYKLIFFVPPDHLEIVKQAVFDTGAGQIGNYDQCCWQILGDGQFRPLTGSKPFIGSQETVTSVPEYRVEMVCADSLIAEAVTALKKAHPYEEPAFDFIKLSLPAIDE